MFQKILLYILRLFAILIHFYVTGIKLFLVQLPTVGKKHRFYLKYTCYINIWLYSQCKEMVYGFYTNHGKKEIQILWDLSYKLPGTRHICQAHSYKKMYSFKNLRSLIQFQYANNSDKNLYICKYTYLPNENLEWAAGVVVITYIVCIFVENILFIKYKTPNDSWNIKRMLTEILH